MSKPVRGLYESLITEALEKELAHLEDRFVAKRKSLQASEAADRIALHLARLVERAISTIDDEVRSRDGTALARHLIDTVIQFLPEAAALQAERPMQPAEVLHHIVSRLPDGRQESIEEPLIPVVRPEIRVVPVTLENRSHLVDHIPIAGCRNTDIPLESTDLCRMGQIGGANIRCRKPRFPVEQPRLRMQARPTPVVRYPDVSAAIPERLERTRLGCARIRRREYPEVSSGSAMVTERCDEWRDAALANKGHDQVNAVGRMNFGEQLVAHTGLSRRIGEQGRNTRRVRRGGRHEGRPLAVGRVLGAEGAD